MITVKRTEKDIEALARLKVDPETLENDGFDWLEKRVVKPWGHEIEKYRDETCSLWWLHLHSWNETSMHCHPNKTTILFIVGGSAILETLNGSHNVSMGSAVVIEKGAFHRTRAKETAVVMYELESPPNKNDLVRLEDRYARGQGYERV